RNRTLPQAFANDNEEDSAPASSPRFAPPAQEIVRQAPRQTIVIEQPQATEPSASDNFPTTAQAMPKSPVKVPPRTLTTPVRSQESEQVAVQGAKPMTLEERVAARKGQVTTKTQPKPAQAPV